MSSRLSLFPAAFVAALALVITLVPAVPARADGALVGLGPAPLSQEVASDLSTLAPEEPFGAFVHFLGGRETDHRRALAGLGLQVAGAYPQVSAYYVVGLVGDFRVLTWQTGVTYIEGDTPIQFFGDTAVWASRARVAQEAVAGGPYRDASGNVLDGSGVGIAIIDSGVNGAHPDLSGRLGANYKIVCSTPFLVNTNTDQCFGPIEFVDVGTTTSDTTSGHGTHVAGIAAGDGTASTGQTDGIRPAVPGTYTGVAPGATLYGFGAGEVDSILYAIESLQYITDNIRSFDPPIRVINNSWGNANGSAYDPNSILSKLVRDLVQVHGVSVVFAASNLGAGEVESATQDQTSGYSKDPTPGVISVANYDDDDTGTRDNALNTGSSTGRVGVDTTYPDISAPGTFVTAACVREVQPICNAGYVDEVRWAPWYSSISGTSMAAPHVAGAAALLYQAVPGLAPAAVEDVMQDTAYKFSAGGAYTSDPQNAGGTHSYDKGAGLLDVKAALDALGVAHDGGGDEGTPDVFITTPTAGSNFDGSADIAIGGTADDGSITPVVPSLLPSFDGDGGDLGAPGAADIVGLRVSETAAGVTPAGMRYTITVRDATDFGGAPATPNIGLRVTQIVDGTEFLSDVTTTPTTVTPVATSSAPATSATRSGNDITMFVPFSNLGDPGPSSIGHNVFVSAFAGGIIDVAPSTQDGSSTGAGDVFTRPMFGRPYEIIRPDLVPSPTVAVRYQVDGGLLRSATVQGESPDYTWSDSIDPTGLADGEHALKATLFVNGLPAATHTTTFTITRAPTYSYDVAVTSPAEGATVPRAVVLVDGTSFTDDPSADRAVTLTLSSALGSESIATSGESPWMAEVDFSERFPGAYTLTARLVVGGVVEATHAVGVIVPTGGDIACSPRNIDFWQGQFKKKSDSLRFSSAEADALAAHAVGLSDGYFTSSRRLKNALGGGSGQPEQAAARQFAALLLNVAAGDIAGDMSYRAGLAGYERLDPAVYATGTVGEDVNEVVSWMRAQFPDRTEDGNLGGASEVANAINNGQGLDC